MVSLMSASGREEGSIPLKDMAVKRTASGTPQNIIISIGLFRIFFSSWIFS